jgi:flagella basal body P-ring formation protein FlgA
MRCSWRTIPFLLVLPSVLGAAAASEIRLRERAVPAGSVVRLGDVAEVFTGDPTDAERLAAVELGPAPATRRYLDWRAVRDALSLAGEDVSDCRFSGASRVEIAPPARQRAAPPPRRASRQQQPDAVEKPVEPEMVVVTTRSIGRGVKLQAGDLELAVSQRGTAENALIDLEEAVGLQTTQVLPAGAVVRAGSVRQPLCVRRGEVVTVHVRAHGLRVRTTARARSDGSQGDVIDVESLLDRTEYSARVCGVQQVEIDVTGVAEGNDEQPDDSLDAHATSQN